MEYYQLSIGLFLAKSMILFLFILVDVCDAFNAVFILQVLIYLFLSPMQYLLLELNLNI